MGRSKRRNHSKDRSSRSKRSKRSRERLSIDRMESSRSNSREPARRRSRCYSHESRSSCRSPASKRPTPSHDTLSLILEKLTKQEERLTSLEVKTAGETEIEEPRSTNADQRSEEETVLQNRGSEPGMFPC